MSAAVCSGELACLDRFPDDLLCYCLQKALGLDATGAYCAPSFLRSGASTLPGVCEHFAHANLSRDPFTTYGAAPGSILQVNRRWAGLLRGMLRCVAIGNLTTSTNLPSRLFALFVRLPRVTVQTLTDMHKVVSGLHSLQKLVISSSCDVHVMSDSRVCPVSFSADRNNLRHYHLHLSTLSGNGTAPCGTISPSLMSLTLTHPWNLPSDVVDASVFTALTALFFSSPQLDAEHYRHVQADLGEALRNSTAWIAQLPALVVLHLPAYTVTDAPHSQRSLSALGSLTGLKDLQYGTVRYRKSASEPPGLIVGMRDDGWDNQHASQVLHEMQYDAVRLDGVQTLSGLTRLCVHLVLEASPITEATEILDPAFPGVIHGAPAEPLRALCCLPDLQHLDLALWRCDDDTLQPLSALSSLTALWLSLRPEVLPNRSFGRGLHFLPSPGDLLSLRVSGLPVMNGEFVTALAAFVALTELSIEDPQTIDTMDHDLDSDSDSDDVDPYLRHALAIDTATTAKVLRVLPRTLRSLRLCDVGATVVTVEAMPALEYLTMSCMQSLDSVVLNEMWQLREISIAGCDCLRTLLVRPTDAALSLVVPRPASETSAEALNELLKSLEIMRVRNPPPLLVDSGSASTTLHSQTAWRPRLTRLWLCGQNIGCCALLPMPHLQLLHITHCLIGHCHALVRRDSLAQLTALTKLRLDVYVGSCDPDSQAIERPGQEYASTLTFTLIELPLLRDLRLVGCKLSLQHLQLLAQSLTRLTRLGLPADGVLAAEGASDPEQPASSEDLGAALRPLKWLELLELKAATVEEGKCSTRRGEYGGSLTRIATCPDTIRHVMGAPSVNIVLC